MNNGGPTTQPVGVLDTMRIQGSNGAALAATPSGARRASGGAFSLGEQEASRQPTGAGPLRTISSLDVLLALQGVEDFTHRKKRAVAKGRHALDALDLLKAGLLDGSVDRSTLARLKVASEGLAEETGDAGLDQVMQAIDLRVAVELAKAGIS